MTSVSIWDSMTKATSEYMMSVEKREEIKQSRVFLCKWTNPLYFVCCVRQMEVWGSQVKQLSLSLQPSPTSLLVHDYFSSVPSPLSAEGALALQATW